ncbi:MAG TPA: SIMPL domain-containing protein [Gemmatimonadales bacterium]
MAETPTSRTPLYVALIGAIGLVLAGAAIGRGFSDARLAERYVSVKGVSEREAKANLALWPIPLVAANDDLALAQTQVARSTERIKAFLVQHGLDTSQAQLQALRVTDRQANPYQAGEAGRRFIIRQTLILRSTEPDKVLAASQRVGELVQAGVVLSSGEEYGPGGPTFLFTNLNEIKPAMIAEATSRAREAAEQFARDAGSRLGGIRQANQGVFVILPRDQAPGVTEESQLFKMVRVVSTVDYYLR